MPPRRLGKHAPPPPDDLRCRRSDGKRWRCPEPVLKGFALCIYHHRRSYQVPNPSPTADPPSATVTPVSDEQKPWKLRIKKPNQPNSAPEARNPNPPPSPPSPPSSEETTENGNTKILPTVLALEHSKSEGKKRRGRKPTPQKETPLPLLKDNSDDNNNNNANNTNTISGAQRCKRSDGRGWQCKARSLPGEHYCDHHYQKVKHQRDVKLGQSRSGSKKRRRAAGMAVAMAKRRREAMTSSMTSAMMSVTDLRSGEEKRELPKGVMTISPSAGGMVKGESTGEKKIGFEPVPIAVRPLRSKNPQPIPVGPVKKLPLGGKGRKKEREGNNKACHRCGEAKAGPVVRCKNCMKRYFCSKCIKIWYYGMSKLEINAMCPVCRNCCSCDTCTRLNNNININNNTVVDIPVREVANGESKIINIKYASYPFSQLLPVIKKLSVEQLDELEIEAKKQGKRVSGALVQVLEKGRDEQINCNYCKGSIIDFSMNCSNCNYKLCLTCSQKIRKEEKFEDLNFENSFLNCKSNSCKLSPNIFHSCDIVCPSKELQGCEGEGNLGLVYSFPIGWSETLIIGQENRSSLASCKTNGHLNSEPTQTAPPSGFL